MEKKQTKLVHIIAIIFSIIFTIGCKEQTSGRATEGIQTIFPKGQLGSVEYFTGKAYIYGLVSNDITYNTLVGNFYLEPGARSNWHMHPSGQILIVTSGIGYHQIKGQLIEIIRSGDVIKFPPKIVHWHGASKDSSMAHIYIVPNTENGIVAWMEPVSDEAYSNVKQLQ